VDLAPRLDPRRCALFLDLDGTLAEIAPRPGDIGPDDRRTRILRDLTEAMDGRIAVLTGRALTDADRILEGAIVAVGATHGLERRAPDGGVVAHLPSRGLAQAKAELAALAGEIEGLHLEDKGASIALHYRAIPHIERSVRAATRRLADVFGLQVQNGAMVSELRVPGPHKGDALTLYLAQAPFAGHTPVMVGDDLTDEHAFAAAAELGGYGVLVGPPRPSAARYRLASVGEVLAWLEAGSRA